MHQMHPFFFLLDCFTGQAGVATGQVPSHLTQSSSSSASSFSPSIRTPSTHHTQSCWPAATNRDKETRQLCCGLKFRWMFFGSSIQSSAISRRAKTNPPGASLKSSHASDGAWAPAHDSSEQLQRVRVPQVLRCFEIHIHQKYSFATITHRNGFMLTWQRGETYPHPAAAPDIFILKLVSLLNAPRPRQRNLCPNCRGTEGRAAVISSQGGEVKSFWHRVPDPTARSRCSLKIEQRLFVTGARPQHGSKGSNPAWGECSFNWHC